MGPQRVEAPRSIEREKLMIKDVYVAGGVRTPFGSFLGTLSEVSAVELGSLAVRRALARAGVQPDDIEEVYFGNVIQAGLGQNVARQVSLGAGISKHTGAVTINKVCGSSMHATIIASQAIQCGDADVIVSGGCESMTNAPYLLPKARKGYRMGNSELVDSMVHDGIWDVYNDKHMGTCGDLCAAKYEISRDRQDAFAIESYKRAIRAWEDGFYKEAVVPVEIKTRKGPVVVEMDEDVSKFNEERMHKLRPAFGPEGTVTAGNASSINDGAAAMVVLSGEKVESLGVRPTGRILGYANYATDPEWFTIAPPQAIRRLCEKVSLKIEDVDLFEINEAFAVVTVLAIDELNLDPAKVNAFGGAAAIGHPIGATGARLINTLLHGLERTGGRIGIACLCIGGGEADAIAVERCV